MEPRLQKLCSNATKVTPAEGFWRHSVPRVKIVCELGPSKKKSKIHPLATLLQSVMLVSWNGYVPFHASSCVVCVFGCWWAIYSWTTFKSTRLLCTMLVSRFVKAPWSFSILQLLVTKKWRKNWSWSSRNITSQKRASPIIIFLPSQLVVGLLGKLYRIYRDRNIIMFWSSSY